MSLNVHDRGMGVLQVAQWLTKKKGITGPFAALSQLKNAQKLIKGETVDGMTLKDLEQYKGAFVKNHFFKGSKFSSSEYAKIESNIKAAKELKRDNGIMCSNLRAYENGLTEISGRHMENFKQLQDAVNSLKEQGIGDQLDELIAKYGEKLDELNQKIGSTQEQINTRRQLLERNGAPAIEDALRGGSIGDERQKRLRDALAKNDVNSAYVATRRLDQSITAEYETLMNKLNGPIDDLKKFLAPDDVPESTDRAGALEPEKPEVAHSETDLGAIVSKPTITRSKSLSNKKRHKTHKRRSSLPQVTHSSSSPATDALKEQAAATQKNMQEKLKRHANYQLLEASAALPDTCLSLLMDDNQRGSGTMLDTLGSLMEEGKITRDAYNKCADVINKGFEQCASLSPLNLQGRFPKIFEEKQNINDALNCLGQCSRSGRGDVEGCHGSINESLEQIDSLCQDGEFRRQLQEAVQPYQDCVNGVLDKLLSLVGDANKDVINGMRAKIQIADHDVSKPVDNEGAQESIQPETTTPSALSTRDAGKPSKEGLEVGKNSPMHSAFNSEEKKFQFHLQNAKKDVSEYKIFMRTSEQNCYKSLAHIEELIGGDKGENLSIFSEKDRKKYIAQYNSFKKNINNQFYARTALYKRGDDFLSQIEGSDFVSVPQDEKTLAQNSRFVRENMSQIKKDYDEIGKKYEALQSQMESFKTALPEAIKTQKNDNKIKATKTEAEQSLENLRQKSNELATIMKIINATNRQLQLSEAGLSQKGLVALQLEALKDHKSIDNETYKQCMEKLEEGSKQLEALNGETQLGIHISDAAQLPAKITEGMNKMEEIAKTGEGDVKACEAEIQKSLNDLSDCHAEEYNCGTFGARQDESSRITRDTLDSIRNLVGEQNRGAFDEIRKDLGLVDS